jgi:hypothetical protein
VAAPDSPNHKECHTNIEKFKQQHDAILDAIARLRDAAAGGIADNAESISAQIVRLSVQASAARSRSLSPALRGSLVL